GELGGLVGLLQELLRRLVERLVAERPAILEVELEAARRTEALHRRRREDDDEGVLDRRELLVEAARDRAAAQSRRLSLVEVLERGENDARVRAVGEAVDREPREPHRVLDAGLLHH